MRCYVYDETGEHLLAEVDLEPECGHDFCDQCGDCLACYASDSCEPGGEEHVWVKYGAEEPEA